MAKRESEARKASWAKNADYWTASARADDNKDPKRSGYLASARDAAGAASTAWEMEANRKEKKSAKRTAPKKKTARTTKGRQ